MASIITYTPEQDQALVTKLSRLFGENDINEAMSALSGLTSKRDIRDAAASIRQAVAEEETVRLAARKKTEAPAAKKIAKAGE